jgi:hypothetical protein
MLCYSQNVDWPPVDEIPSQIIIDYIVQRQPPLSEEELKQEYNYILEFLVEAINIHKKNLFNRLNPSYYTKKRPVLLNGKLGFESVGGGSFTWDSEKGVVCEVADINVGQEAVDLICALKTYNFFIVHWYMKTGELLQDKVDIKNELDILIQLEESRQSP